MHLQICSVVVLLIGCLLWLQVKNEYFNLVTNNVAAYTSPIFGYMWLGRNHNACECYDNVSNGLVITH